MLKFDRNLKFQGDFMAKEVVKFKKTEKKEPTMTPKERKAKKQEKKQNKSK